MVNHGETLLVLVTYGDECGWEIRISGKPSLSTWLGTPSLGFDLQKMQRPLVG